jgi:small subunit ribosomal protein S17
MTTNATAKERNKRKKIIGVVTSAKMQKTITVKSERRVMHPEFKKYIRKWTTCHAHDELGEAREGDKVLLLETRPLSKTKNWRLVKVLERKEG